MMAQEFSPQEDSYWIRDLCDWSGHKDWHKTANHPTLKRRWKDTENTNIWTNHQSKIQLRDPWEWTWRGPDIPNTLMIVGLTF